MIALTTLTIIVNLIALAASLWLGFYILTRSPASAHSRLAALMLWSLDAYFVTNVLWSDLNTNVYLAWLLQLAVLALPLMLHLSARLMPVRPQLPRTVRLGRVNQVCVPLAYGTAILLVLAGVLPSNPPVGLFKQAPESATAQAHLGLVSAAAGPVYPLFVAFLVLVSLLALANLWTARAQARGTPLTQPLSTLIAATAIAAAGAAYSAFGTWLQFPIPTFPGDLFFGASILLLGYAVARYAALLEGRPVDRDFLYALLFVGVLSGVFAVAAVILYLNGQITFFALVLGIMGSVAANSALDGARAGLDRLFYAGQFQSLRGNLRALAREAGTGGTLSQRLQASLTSLCRAYQISSGLIVSKGEGHWTVQASHPASRIGETFDLSALTAAETLNLAPLNQRELPGMQIVIPLFGGGSQVGAVALGHKQSNELYSDSDIELLEDLADQIGAVMRAGQLQEEHARAIDSMVQDFRERERGLQMQLQEMLAARPPAGPVGEPDRSVENLVPQVEDALRKLHDYAYLGEHPLSKLRRVDDCLRERGHPAAGFVERGKAVGQVLTEAMDQLRPNGPRPDHNAIPSREWHPFIILHDSYVEDESNREIMSRLYIGEGTFNRIRRRALYAVAKSLHEMEQRAP